MRKFLESCAGIDVGKREVAVTVLTGNANEEPKEESRLFETTVPALEKLRAWLIEERCSSAVMESTGSYWLPVWNVIQDAVAVIVANPEHVKARRGEKTDIQDSRRLAERLRVGEVRGSFVPSQEIQQLRDLTRRRKRLLGNASSERNRVQKILERANVKIGNVVGDVFGISGQQILDALMHRQEMNPAQLADLAKGRLRAKREKLAETLEGHRLNDHDRWMLQQSIDHMVFLEQQMAELEKRILQQLQPLQREYELLQTIPGIKQDTAAVILAETGGDMAQFPTEKNLTSWAGVCPGNNRSAGRQKSSHIRHGNKWLTSALVQASWGAIRKRGAIFQSRFYRQQKHRGRKRAVIAACRGLLVVIHQVLRKMEPYRGPQNAQMQQREREKVIRHHLRKLRHLGVDLPPLEQLCQTANDRPTLSKPPQRLGALGVHSR